MEGRGGGFGRGNITLGHWIYLTRPAFGSSLHKPKILHLSSIKQANRTNEPKVQTKTTFDHWFRFPDTVLNTAIRILLSSILLFSGLTWWTRYGPSPSVESSAISLRPRVSKQPIPSVEPVSVVDPGSEYGEIVEAHVDDLTKPESVPHEHSQASAIDFVQDGDQLDVGLNSDFHLSSDIGNSISRIRTDSIDSDLRIIESDRRIRFVYHFTRWGDNRQLHLNDAAAFLLGITMISLWIAYR